MTIPRTLIEAVVDLLTLAEKAGLSFRTVDLEDRETFQLYAAVLAAQAIEPAHVKRAALLLMSAEKEFPKPATVLAYCEKARELISAEAERERVSRLVIAIDEHGNRVAIDRSRVRAGRVLPPGDHSGDGSPAKALEASNELSEDWITDFWKKRGKGKRSSFARAMVRDILGDRDSRRGGSDGLPELRKVGE